MAMQMLEAGGLPALTDGARPPDEDNPRGYYELEAAKAAARDVSWVAGARGRAVKVIPRLLPALPAAHAYRVVVMRRPLPEIRASQDAMLARSGSTTGAMEGATFERLFARELARAEAWLRSRPHIPVLELFYPDVVADPPAAARALDTFLGGDLDTDAMARTVAPHLHRQRVS
jgi:hypothetical protein